MLRSHGSQGVLLGGTMDYFIHRQNLAHYRRLLAEPNVTSDQVRHRELTRLLAAEMAKDETLPPIK